MKELIKFQTDRGLDKKEFDALNETANIIEELLESIGLNVAKEDRPQLKDKIEEFFTILSLSGIVTNDNPSSYPSNFDQVDAYCDIITFATGALLKLGHNPEIAIDECGKEINSREGTYNPGSKKWEKFKTPEAKAKWYKADYESCKSE